MCHCYCLKNILYQETLPVTWDPTKSWYKPKGLLPVVATLGTLVAPATWDPYEIPQAGYTHYENQLHVICFIYSPPLNAPKKTHSKHVQNKAENCLIHNWMQWSTVKNTPCWFWQISSGIFHWPTDQGESCYSMGISWGISQFYSCG